MASTLVPRRENQSAQGFQPDHKKILDLENMVSKLVSPEISEHSVEHVGTLEL